MCTSGGIGIHAGLRNRSRKGCEFESRLVHQFNTHEWRNWKTHQTQTLGFGICGFKSHLVYQNRTLTMKRPESCFFRADDEEAFRYSFCGAK